MTRLWLKTEVREVVVTRVQSVEGPFFAIPAWNFEARYRIPETYGKICLFFPTTLANLSVVT